MTLIFLALAILVDPDGFMVGVKVLGATEDKPSCQAFLASEFDKHADDIAKLIEEKPEHTVQGQCVLVAPDDPDSEVEI